MGLFNLDKIFSLRSIAVIGAGEKKGSIGRALMHNLTRGGLKILVRPIRPEDAHLFAELFKILSPTTIYHRFFIYMKSLSPEMLARMTQIDYDREMALVAIDQSADPEKILGAARIVGDPDGLKAEFSVLVGDAWQGKGIGAKLLEHLLNIARQRKSNTYGAVYSKRISPCSVWGKKLVLLPASIMRKVCTV
jgi:acetyltransferase